MGTASLSARIGGILCPYINMLSDSWTPLPLIIYGVLAFTAGLLALLLPETLGRELPETIQDGADIGSGNDAKQSLAEKKIGNDAIGSGNDAVRSGNDAKQSFAAKEIGNKATGNGNEAIGNGNDAKKSLAAKEIGNEAIGSGNDATKGDDDGRDASDNVHERTMDAEIKAS